MADQFFKTFGSFGSEQEVEVFTSILEKGEVEFMVEEIPQQAGSIMGGGPSQDLFRVRVKSGEFDRVNELLEERAKEVINSVPEDHYLLEFSDDELKDILRKPDEWSRQDKLLCILILKQRGTQITKEQIQQYEAERILELDKQEIGRPGMLILGLLFSLAGGLIGLLIGWFHWKAHKDTVAGGKIFRFEDKTRSRGKSIFWIGVISFVGWISTAFIV